MYGYRNAPQVTFANKPVKPVNVWSKYGKAPTPKFIPG